MILYLANCLWPTMATHFQKTGQEVRLLDSLGFLGLYLAYILVVLGGRFIHNRNRVDLPYAGWFCAFLCFLLLFLFVVVGGVNVVVVVFLLICLVIVVLFLAIWTIMPLAR